MQTKSLRQIASLTESIRRQSKDSAVERSASMMASMAAVDRFSLGYETPIQDTGPLWPSRDALQVGSMLSIVRNVFVTLATIICFHSVSFADDLPNIIIFLVDDVGFGDIQANNPEGGIPTPHLNRLAKNGANFINAHSSASVCAPTRYSLLTGNHVYRGRNAMGTWAPFSGSQIRTNQKTLASLLRDNGYATAFFGKSHLGGVKSDDGEYGRFRKGPLDHGFDYSLTLPSGIQAKPHAFFQNDRLSRWDNTKKEFAHFEDAEQAGRFYKNERMDNWSTETVGPLLMHDALRFIDEHQEKHQNKKPFFIHYCSQAGHTPYVPPEHFNVKDPLDTTTGIPIHGQTTNPRTDMVYEADVAVGLFKERLQQHQIWDNTLLIFTSDNGVAKGIQAVWSNPIYTDYKDGKYGGIRTEKSLTSSGKDHINGQGVINGVPLRGKKGYCYEGGHRVPLLFHWPVRIRGHRVEQLIGLHDLYRTLAGILGIEVEAEQAIDSVDLSSAVLSDEKNPVRRHLLIQANRPNNSTNKRLNSWSFYSVEPEKDSFIIWKALVNNNKSTPTNSGNAEVTEIYNLSDDPGESQPVSDANRAANMLGRYRDGL